MFGMSLETQENQIFWRISRDFWRDNPGAPEKLKNMLNFWLLKKNSS